MARIDKNLTLEDVTIAFRNFAGKEDMYNRAGDRNFAIFLDPDLAAKMLADGWNVKHLKERDGEPPQAYLQVAVSYKNRPPKIGLVTSKSITYLGEAEIEMLDWVDIEQADVTINPYEWVVNGKTGVKAYVATLFIKIYEDYLQLKWTAYVDGQRQSPKAIEAADYIEGEYELT
jgi:hypothetical protein